MMTNQYIYQTTGAGDPMRLGAQVVSGIGFLGAGTIVVTRHNQIKGLTTAAGLWASACVGLAIGIGLYEVAVVGGIAIYVVLTVLHQWDFAMRSKTQIIDVYLELDQAISLGVFLRNCRDRDILVSNIQKEHDSGFSDEVFAFIATFQGKQIMKQDELVRRIRRLEGVKYMEIL
jgi:putative Mg2+ transporter-C (MgtC) family protein